MIEVWIADLDAPGAEGAKLESLLSEDERERAVALRSASGRARWSVSRALLRQLLGQRLRLDPATITFSLGPNGKPRLTEATQARAGSSADDLRFNVSHSGGLALYAIASSCEVGVDVELEERRSTPPDELAVARRLLGQEVVGKLEGLPPQRRLAEFLRSWTSHEAKVKCLGLGIGAGRDAAHKQALEALSVRELDVGEGAFAAVAMEGAPAEVEVRRWRW